MIVYQSTKQGFLSDVDDREIEEVIEREFVRRTNRYAFAGEVRAWKESLKEMGRVLRGAAIPGNVGVGVEFGIGQTQKRIDMVLTGYDKSNSPRMVIVELKQWSDARVSDYDGLIVARRGGAAEVEGPHPSYQAWSYAAFLISFNDAVYSRNVGLRPCAYLHNYPDGKGAVNDERYEQYLELAPIFLKGEVEREKLRKFLAENVCKGDDAKLLFEIDNGRLRPSKVLADSVAEMLRGNPEFVLLDEQKVAFELAMAAALGATKTRKRVVIVKGGPGTGKSVIAINLLSELTRRKRATRYISKNAAPRTVYQQKLKGKFKRAEIGPLFGSTGTFHECPPDTYGALIVDEAHRMNRLSGLFGNLGQNQVSEVIRSAKCSVFFVDDDQLVTLKDIGTSDEIRRCAVAQKAMITEIELSSQFRCNGSEGYLPWLDNLLGIRPKPDDQFDRSSFDFRVIESAADLHDLIESKNEGNRARVTAGYCWDWRSKKQPKEFDITIGDYRRRWNLGKDGSLWIVARDSVAEVGCIHTCQGLEVDYVGVILGPDFLIRDGVPVTNAGGRSKMDRSVRGYKQLLKSNPVETLGRLDAIIKNTYRTLMTRGLKGCFVYSVDSETQAYLRSKASGAI